MFLVAVAIQAKDKFILDLIMPLKQVDSTGRNLRRLPADLEAALH